MRENDFTINIKDLETGPVTVQVNAAPEKLELDDPEFSFSTVTGDITFSLVRPRVVARGTLETDAKTHCVRCLSEATIHVKAPVHAIYENEKQIRDTRGEAVGPEEQVITPFNGDWIQPEQELREAIMLELPMLPLCSEDCKGLCVKCGANLNEGPCACDTKAEDVSPWKQALKELKLDESATGNK
jgi:uncharacterized protein